jgi:hypothetical protein
MFEVLAFVSLASLHFFQSSNGTRPSQWSFSRTCSWTLPEAFAVKNWKNTQIQTKAKLHSMLNEHVAQ